MQNTLEKKSTILMLKSKFFLFRAVIYFSFLLIPVWIQKSTQLNAASQSFLMLLYLFFIVGQWFMLGKEIDHRFHIYFKVNSAIDRVIYRLMTGLTFFVIYFNLLALLPYKWTYNLFWVTWVILGLFYSWPTRGKIIQESVTSTFSELRYLDKFEKTVLGFILFLFIITIPALPSLLNFEALRLYFDPQEHASPLFWNFLVVNYFPFKRYPELFRIAWNTHFYIVGVGSFLLIFYAFLRYYFSRRLALLGVFVFSSSWIVSKVLGSTPGTIFASTYSLLIIWSLLWISKSGTYRSGLLVGVLCFIGTLYDYYFFFLSPLILLGSYLFLFPEKTAWFKRQFLRYSLLGLIFAALAFAFSWGNSELNPLTFASFKGTVYKLFDSKAFLATAIPGIILFSLKIFRPKLAICKSLLVDRNWIIIFSVALLTLFFYSLTFTSSLLGPLALLWPLIFLALIPLEMIFQHLSRFRSQRNLIYVIYVVICLLDSHIEGRIKILIKFFKHAIS